MLFIDGTNLDHRLEEGVGSLDIDFPKFFKALASGTQLLHTHYFTAPYISSRGEKQIRMRSRQSRTFNILDRMADVTLHKGGRYQLRDGKCHNCKHQFQDYEEKGTDVHAATMLVMSACKAAADTFIFLSNDNDYAPAFEICAGLGAKVILAYVSSNDYAYRTVGQLRRHSKGQVIIDKAFMQNLWLQNPKTSVATPARR